MKHIIAFLLFVCPTTAAAQSTSQAVQAAEITRLSRDVPDRPQRTSSADWIAKSPEFSAFLPLPTSTRTITVSGCEATLQVNYEQPSSPPMLVMEAVFDLQFVNVTPQDTGLNYAFLPAEGERSAFGGFTLTSTVPGTTRYRKKPPSGEHPIADWPMIEELSNGSNYFMEHDPTRDQIESLVNSLMIYKRDFCTPIG